MIKLPGVLAIGGNMRFEPLRQLSILQPLVLVGRSRNVVDHRFSPQPNATLIADKGFEGPGLLRRG